MADQGVEERSTAERAVSAATHGLRNREARDRMGAAIRALVAEYAKHPWDINNGQCDEFAEEIARRIPGATAYALAFKWGHTVIRYEGLFYDAEEPYGVPHWRQLPLCVRHRRRRG